MAQNVLGMPIAVLALVAVAGLSGSVASIMVRLRDFAEIRGRTDLELFLIGLMRPILGVLFAWFVYAVVSAALLPLQIPTGKEAFFWAAVGFVAGFSERFAPDVAGETEGKILASRKAKASDTAKS